MSHVYMCLIGMQKTCSATSRMPRSFLWDMFTCFGIPRRLSPTASMCSTWACELEYSWIMKAKYDISEWFHICPLVIQNLPAQQFPLASSSQCFAAGPAIVSPISGFSRIYMMRTRTNLLEWGATRGVGNAERGRCRRSLEVPRQTC